MSNVLFDQSKEKVEARTSVTSVTSWPFCLCVLPAYPTHSPPKRQLVWLSCGRICHKDILCLATIQTFCAKTGGKTRLCESYENNEGSTWPAKILLCSTRERVLRSSTGNWPSKLVRLVTTCLRALGSLTCVENTISLWLKSRLRVLSLLTTFLCFCVCR